MEKKRARVVICRIKFHSWVEFNFAGESRVENIKNM